MTLAASETCRPHGDARLEPDTSGCRRDGAEHHGDPRRQEQARMALSDGIGIEAQLLGSRAVCTVWANRSAVLTRRPVTGFARCGSMSRTWNLIIRVPLLVADGRPAQARSYGVFSPASIPIGRRFSAGGSGHVAKSVKAHGRLIARLKSRATFPSSSGGSTRSTRLAA